MRVSLLFANNMLVNTPASAQIKSTRCSFNDSQLVSAAWYTSHAEVSQRVRRDGMYFILGMRFAHSLVLPVP